jgi:hypothetical protein
VVTGVSACEKRGQHCNNGFCLHLLPWPSVAVPY